MRIAMWSGPRNLSTAMMYSFGNRPDFAVVDEPFYACYLDKTGYQHPMRDEVLMSQPRNADEVITSLIGSIPEARPHIYQKHMTQHMLEGVDLAWMAEVKNVFLIRHPARVAKSFSAKYDGFGSDEIGFKRQWELYEYAKSLGQSPIVIDSSDIRENPRTMLSALCAALDLEFMDDMLNWPKGGHSSDGIWAKHWYGSVHGSTGFDGPEGPMPQLTGALEGLMTEAFPYYQRLSELKLVP